MNSPRLRAKYLFKERDERAGDRDFPLLSVSALRGVVRRSELTADEPRADDLSRYKICEGGDLVINRMSAYQGALGIAHEMGIVSPDYTVLTPVSIEPGFAHHLVRSSWFVAEMTARLRGIGTSDQGNVRTPRINAEDFGDIRAAVPPVDVQRQIADFLDDETARIDALIEKKRRLLRLMSLRRSSAIGGALESAGCEFVPLRRVVAAFIDYRGATPEKTPSGVPLITATNVSDGRIDFSPGEQFVSEETYVEWMRRGFPGEGDVLLTTEAPLGEVAMISNPRVALAQRIILLKPDSRRVLPEFLYASLRSPVVRADLLSRASGSTVWGIRADRLRDVGVHITSLPEQRRVVTVMRRFDDEYRRAQEFLERQIDLLREHRQALISAAVTGQLDVAKAAA